MLLASMVRICWLTPAFYKVSANGSILVFLFNPLLFWKTSRSAANRYTSLANIHDVDHVEYVIIYVWCEMFFTRDTANYLQLRLAYASAGDLNGGSAMKSWNKLIVWIIYVKRRFYFVEF